MRQPLAALAGLTLPCLWCALFALDPTRIVFEKSVRTGWIHEFAFAGQAVGTALAAPSLSRLTPITRRLDPWTRSWVELAVLLCAGAAFAVAAVLPGIVSTAAVGNAGIADISLAQLAAAALTIAAVGVLALRLPLPAQWTPWMVCAMVVALVPVSIARPDTVAQGCVASGLLIAVWLADRRMPGRS